MEPLLTVRDLKTEFFTTRGVVHAIDGVDLEIGKGEVLGLVGESGCGKSVTALSIMFLIPQPPGRIASGQIWFRGVNLLAGTQGETAIREGRGGKVRLMHNDRLLKRHRARMSRIRGREMSMIFQEPMSSLNPVLQVGYQVAEVLLYQRRAEIIDSLLSRGNLSEGDLDIFRQATATPDAEERDHLIADFCMRTGIPAERVTAVVESSGLRMEQRVERIQHLAERRRLGNRRFLELVKRLDLIENGRAAHEWQELSHRSLGEPAARLFDHARTTHLADFPRLSRVAAGEDGVHLIFKDTPPSEDLRARVEAFVKASAKQPDWAMFSSVAKATLGKESIDLTFEKDPETSRFREEAEYRSQYVTFRLLMALPILRKRLMRPIEEEARRHVLELLKLVRIPEPTKVYNEYPHELSGGMQQRVMIAMALACDPSLMIADEPTTALDVTTQAQILKLVKDLRQRVNSAILYITHDLAVIAEISDRIAVMYAGKVVEDAPVDELFAHPLHPYTQGLLESIVTMDSQRTESGVALPTIPGTVPDLRNPPSGCRFHPRCPFAFERCRVEDPARLLWSEGHKVACHLYTKEPPS